MKNLSYVANEIVKGKNINDNLKKYAVSMSSMYNTLAYIKFSMNYYTVLCEASEIVSDDIKCDNNLIIQEVDKVNTLIEAFLEKGVYDGLLDEIESIRNEIISIMETVTNYVDCFRIYEHVLNRIEYRFNDVEPDVYYYNNELTNDVMHYILSDKDNVVINSKISEVVGQLPVRMTKGRFFEHIRDAFTLYHGAGKSSIDDFYYALSTSAMIDNNLEKDERFTEIKDIFLTLNNADYSNLDKTECERLRGALDIATDKMAGAADVFVLLAQVINDFYTISLTENESLSEVSENVKAKEIIKKTITEYNSNCDFEEIATEFEAFEGKQERILMSVSSSDFAIEYVIANYSEYIDELKLKKIYDSLSKVLKLQSGSDFVSLSAKEPFDEIMGDEYADDVCDRLIFKLDDAFKNMQTPVKRAVMAAVLSSLPVFFNNTEEIQGYINNSLIQCNDKAEQAAVIELIRMLIKQ